MANRVLGIEYAGDRIKIVEVSFGRKLKVFNFAVIDNRTIDPARRTDQLNHTLKTRGFEAKDALIAASGGHTEHRLLTLPPLSTREMHFVMQRESKKLAPAGMAEMLWSYDLLRTKEELGIKKNQILLVTAERPMVDAAQNLLNQTRVKPQQVTTIPEAVLNLLRQVTAWKKDAVRTVVHFAGTGVHIMFVQDGVLLLSREIHFVAEDMALDQQIERLGNELKRSTLYFRQNFPQALLDQIIFSGDSELLGTLSTRSQEELGIPGSILRIEENLDTSGFRGSWDEFRFHLPALTAALGAAWRKTPGLSGVNLLPGKTQAKEQAGINPTKIARAACAASVGIALLTGIYYVSARGNIDAETRSLMQRASIVDPKLAQIQQIETRRNSVQLTRAVMHRIGGETDWTEMLRSISFIVPSSAVFENIRLEGGEQTKMTIRGFLSVPTAEEGTKEFNRFFNELRALPFFKSVTMPKPTTVSFVDTPGLKPASAGGIQSKVSFEVVCELP